MRVYIARDVDHCFGVKRAINMTRQALVDNDDVFIMGDLIHNRAVTAELEACGLRTVDDFQGCASGTMVVRAHGLPRAQLQAAHDAGLNMIDATCQIVYKHQEAARELEARGCQVILIGDKNHPEIKGVLGALERPAVVIESVEELRQAKLDKLLLRKVGVTFQTTHSFERCLPIVLELIGMAKEVQVINTFCRPVRHRQLDAVDLAAQVDLMLILGSRSSANTAELKHLCEKYTRTIQIENAEQIDPASLQGVEAVGIASGLSTPPDLVEAVKAWLIQRAGAVVTEDRPTQRPPRARKGESDESHGK